MINIIPISEAVAKNKEYLDKRRAGEIMSLLTPWRSFNEETGGLEINTVTLFASPSGGGKTSVMVQLEEELPKLNTTLPVEALCFSLEMMSRNIITRKLSKSMNVSTRYINQAYNEKPMTDEHYAAIQKRYSYYKNHNVSYVEEMLTAAQMEEVIIRHRTALIRKYSTVDKFIFYVAIDHSVLILKAAGQDERNMLVDVGQMLVRQKKIGNSLFLILSQTNDGLDDRERLLNKWLQAPVKSDIFGGRALYHASDYVIVSVNPAQMRIPHWECYAEGETTHGKLYWHILKQREGAEVILRMKNELHVSKISDYIERTA